jgi:hypothetical protein
MDNACTWSEEEDKHLLPMRVFETVKDIETRQQSIHAGHLRHARMYSGYTPVGLEWGSNGGIRSRPPNEVSRMMARSICDTAT